MCQLMTTFWGLANTDTSNCVTPNQFKCAQKRTRVHFIPDLKVGVFVTLHAPEVINVIIFTIIGQKAAKLQLDPESMIEEAITTMGVVDPETLDDMLKMYLKMTQ